jgi:ABC-type bacteriocin/lantibiotic exporter with double-glycine peptidase domain
MKNREIIKYYKEILLICKPFWKYGVYGGIFGLIFSIFNLPGPFLTKYVIDKILPSKNVTFLNIIVILMFFFILSKIISNFLNNLFLFLFRSKSTILLQAELFNHMEYLPMDFYKKYNTGECVSRILNDVSNLQGLIGDTILQIFKNIFTFLIGIGVLFFLNVKLAFISFFTLPFYLYFANFYSLEIRKISGELQQKYSYLYNLLFENIFSIPLIKAFCLEERQYKIVFNQLTSIFSTHLKLRKVSLLFSSASSKRIFEILPLPREEKGNIKLKKLRGNIEYEKISFSYDGINFVFKDLSLYIKEKEKVLIIGKSGVGKTTLVNLLIKFYLPQKGEIYLNGLSIKKNRCFFFKKKIRCSISSSFYFFRNN